MELRGRPWLVEETVAGDGEFESLRLSCIADDAQGEINPQGQFLFLEPLTDFPFAEVFAEFLIAEGASPEGNAS